MDLVILSSQVKDCTFIVLNLVTVQLIIYSYIHFIKPA